MNHPNLTLDEELKAKISQNLSGFKPNVMSESSARQAAVALTIVNVGNVNDSMVNSNPDIDSREAALILTLRSSGLKTHSGQWALPGGRIEQGETKVETALRELKEEVNLTLCPDDLLGFLDDFETRSGFVISPVVFWGGMDARLIPDPIEVDSIHRIPTREFLRKDAPLLSSYTDSEHPVLMMPIGYTAIAAPTGAILYQFREVAILGKDTRVAHYEQPGFAWS